MFKFHILASFALALIITTTNALSLPQFFKRSPNLESVNPVSHLLVLNNTHPDNVPYNDIYFYVNVDLHMDLRVPADDLWRPVSNLLCIKRMDFLPINGTMYPKNCTKILMQNATNYGHATCMILDTISWFTDLGSYTNIDLSNGGTGMMANVCCGNGCTLAGFHF